MYTHYIILSSSYSNGERIGLDFKINDEEQHDLKLDSVVKKIINKCGQDVSISTHFIRTESKSWKSVLEKDHFFKDVKLIDSVDKFILLIRKDRELLGIDVARIYIKYNTWVYTPKIRKIGIYVLCRISMWIQSFSI